MGNHRTTGLTKRGGVWHIDKVFRGTRIRESTATGDVAKAQEYYRKVVAIADAADDTRTEVAEARAFLAKR